MEVKNSPIKPVGRVRSQKKVIPRLLNIVSERLVKEGPIRLAVVHADAESQAWELAKKVRQQFSPDELITSEITPVLGAHTGPDALGLAYSSGIDLWEMKGIAFLMKPSIIFRACGIVRREPGLSG